MPIQSLILRRLGADLSRVVVLFVVSQVLLRLSKRFRNNARVKKWIGSDEVEKSAIVVPKAKRRSSWLPYKLLGHLADIKPWENQEDGEVSYKLIRMKETWYKFDKDEESDIVQVDLFKNKTVFTKDLSLISAMHGKEDSLFRNSDVLRRAWGELFPTSIAVLKDDDWRLNRRVFVTAINGLDHNELVKSTATILQEGLNNFLTQDVTQARLWDLFSRITFDSFHSFMYGIKFNSLSGQNVEVMEAMITIASNISNRWLISFPFLWNLPMERNRLMFKSKDILYKFIDEHVRLRLEKYERDPVSFTKKNMLDSLILSTKDDPNRKIQKMTVDEIKSQLVTSSFGGFDTTTSSLSFLIVSLCENPEYQDKLFNEVRDVDLVNSSKKFMNELQLLNAIIKETQRLSAVGELIARVPNKDVVINGKLLEEGTDVMCDLQSLGKVPEYWNGAQDLDKFRPERWFDFTPLKGTFNPFGFGGRKCPGFKVAETQMQVILTHLVQNYKFYFAERPIKRVCSLGMTVDKHSSVLIQKR